MHFEAEGMGSFLNSNFKRFPLVSTPSPLPSPASSPIMTPSGNDHDQALLFPFEAGSPLPSFSPPWTPPPYTVRSPLQPESLPSFPRPMIPSPSPPSSPSSSRHS